MTRPFRIAVVPALALAFLAAGCGQTQRVQSSPAHPATPAVVPAAAVQASPSTAPPGAVLSDLAETLEGPAPMHGTVTVNTKNYDNSVYGNLCFGPLVWEFNLNRQYKSLTGTVGLDDNSIMGTQAVVTFKVDNSQVGQAPVQLGRTQNIDIPVSGALRLEIDVQSSGPACQSSMMQGSNVVIGNAQLTK